MEGGFNSSFNSPWENTGWSSLPRLRGGNRTASSFITCWCDLPSRYRIHNGAANVCSRKATPRGGGVRVAYELVDFWILSASAILCPPKKEIPSKSLRRLGGLAPTPPFWLPPEALQKPAQLEASLLARLPPRLPRPLTQIGNEALGIRSCGRPGLTRFRLKRRLCHVT